MKKTQQNFLILFPLLLITSSSLILNVTATTVGDTSVGAEINDIYTYVVTQVNETNAQVGIGDKIEVTITSLSPLLNGVPNGYLNVNITIRSYNKSSDTWTVDQNVYRTLSYNATSQTLDRIEIIRAFVLPTPLNVTLMSSLIDVYPMTISTPVGDNGINISPTIGFPPPVYTYIYNSNGIAISRTLKYGSDLMEVYVLDKTSDLPGPSVPFGMYFLVFTSIAMVALVIILKKRNILFKE